MTSPADHRVGWTTLVSTIVAVAAVALVPSVWPPAYAIALGAMAVAVGESLDIHMPLARHGMPAQLSVIAIALSLTVAPGPWIILAAPAGALIGRVVRPGASDRYGHGRELRLAGAVAVAVILSTVAGGSPESALLGMVGLWLTCVVTAFVVPAQHADGHAWSRAVGLSAISSCSAAPLGVLAGIGVLAGSVVVTGMSLLAGLAQPLVVVMLRREREAARLGLSLLDARSGGLRPTTPMGVAAALLTAAYHLLAARSGWMWLDEPGHPTRRFTLLPDGRVVTAADDVVEDVPHSSRTVTSGERGDHAWLTLRTTSPDGAVAVVHLERPLHGSGGFSWGERGTAEAMARLAAGWLTGLPSPEASTSGVPAIASAADRLVQTASAPRTDLRAVLAELHRLEAAVTSLVARADGPDA